MASSSDFPDDLADQAPMRVPILAFKTIGESLFRTIAEAIRPK